MPLVTQGTEQRRQRGHASLRNVALTETRARRWIYHWVCVILDPWLPSQI